MAISSRRYTRRRHETIGSILLTYANRGDHWLRRPDRLRERSALRPSGVRRDRPRERHARPPSSVLRRRRARTTAELTSLYAEFRSLPVDIRDREAVDQVFARHARAIEIVVHTAAQPSHDWAASDPHTDFGVNAAGTLNLLEATRRHAPDAAFIFTSTNKVYGDLPNSLPLVELDTRVDLPVDHRWFGGVDTTHVDRPLDPLIIRRIEDRRRPARAGVRAVLSICRRYASGAGVSLDRVMPERGYTASCRISCVALSPDTPTPSTGTRGKQVRDNIHSADVVAAFDAFRRSPRSAAVYNLGGGGNAVARCSKLSSFARGSVVRRSTGACRTRHASAIITGGSRIFLSFAPTTQDGDHDWTRGHAPRDICAQSRALGGRGERLVHGLIAAMIARGSSRLTLRRVVN